MRRLPAGDIEYIAEALIDGGITGLEITLDSDEALECIKKLNNKFGDRAIIGAGTVVNSLQAKKAINYGTKFIFSPILDKEIIEIAKEHNTIVIPGVYTPTEAYKATQYGADLVKIFPADTLGPSFIKGVKAPLPEVRMMPTGGISLDNLKEFLDAGADAVGVGGSLLDKSLIEKRDWNQLTNLASRFVNEAGSSNIVAPLL
jgi:2-dehydro-3-deoxyphosphogluconate aldolase/(4S)-4-hydroxy-2-oxoglutarate aldolase